MDGTGMDGSIPDEAEIALRVRSRAGAAGDRTMQGSRVSGRWRSGWGRIADGGDEPCFNGRNVASTCRQPRVLVATPEFAKG
jgi:hypothetical protein